MFIEVGYHETTMDQIAEEAEYSKGTFYNYFENKEHLFFCMLIEKLEIFTQGLKIRIQKQSDIENKIIVKAQVVIHQVQSDAMTSAQEIHRHVC